MFAQQPNQNRTSVPASLARTHTALPGWGLQRKPICACGATCARCTAKAGSAERAARPPQDPWAEPLIPGLQADLMIGESDDPLEKEADRVADQVLAAPAHLAAGRAAPSIQRHAQRFGHDFSRIRVHSGPAAERPARDANDDAHTVGRDTITAPPSVQSVLAGAGRPLNPALRQDMEQRFGHDFSRVRVHSGPAAEQSARDVNANAYTVGRHIVFGASQFAPGTHEGRRLLAHELTHVVQQSGSSELDLARGGGSSAARLQRQTKSTKCTDEVVTALHTKMHSYCDKQRSCTMQGDSCATATSKVAAGYGCVDERTKLQQKCFSRRDPGYHEHMQQIAEANAALRNCIAVMMARCAAQTGAIVALSAAAAAAAAAKKRLKSAAGRAVIHAQVAAAVILLISGKAEAKISLEGDSPLEALFKAMEQDGVAVPEEMKKLIDSDPELKKMLEESAKKGGTLSDVQKQVAQEYAEYVSKHMDEFSKEELQTILASTDQVADKVPATMKVEDIKRALKERVAREAGQAQKDGEGTGTSAPKPPVADGAANAGGKDEPAQTTGTPVGATGTQSTKLKDLSVENKKRIKGAPPPVSRLFQEFAAGQKEDIGLDDAAVKEFFEIVPTDLTDKQAEALVSRLASSQGKTTGAVLKALKQGVAEVSKDATPTGDTTTNGAASDRPGKSQQQVVEELMEMAKKADFSKVPEGKYVIRNLSDTIVKGEISAHFYGKLNGVGVVGRIRGTVPADLDVAKLKAGSTFVVTITSNSPFVDKDGNIRKIQLGNTVTVKK
ncbi:eCIS core domain-containing protein [Sorangium sp. So ce394]|uniref:eCIS core domain-containing protein n=1 Tax=Sorangium sp. So ce394 TaxID=3133310 RepID=UPI003F5B5DAF